MPERLSSQGEIQNTSESDKHALHFIEESLHGKYFFGGNTQNEIIPPFKDAFESVLTLKAYPDSTGNLTLNSLVDFRGKSYIRTTLTRVKESEKGKPVVIVIPGYGNTHHTTTWFFLGGLEEISDCSIWGVEVFHKFRRMDQVRVGFKVQNLQAAFASAIKATQEAIHMAKAEGSKTIVVGTSFGAKTINAMLNLAEEYNLVLPDDCTAIEGGNFVETFSGKYYRKKMANPHVVFNSSFARAFPHQAHELPNGTGKLVTAVINPTDDIALGQEECWRGARETILIPGLTLPNITTSHFFGPFLPLSHLSAIRSSINSSLAQLKR